MRILLADDQPKLRLGLRLLLEQEGWATVVGEAGDAHGLLNGLLAAQPDVVLLDWNLPGAEEQNPITAMLDCCPDLAVVVLSGRPEAEQAAIRAGADFFVSKADPPEKLLEALESLKTNSESTSIPAARSAVEQPQGECSEGTGGQR